MDKKHCAGCHSNFYNGRKNIGGNDCWSLKTAKMVWRIAVGHWENPPYLNKKKHHVPDCWQGEGSNRTHYIDPEKRLTPQGFWK